MKLLLFSPMAIENRLVFGNINLTLKELLGRRRITNAVAGVFPSIMHICEGASNPAFKGLG